LHLFDGHGARVKKVAGGVTTVYIGGHYEKQGGTVFKYYSFNGRRVAMNKAGVVYYLLGDHVSRTARVLNYASSEATKSHLRAGLKSLPPRTQRTQRKRIKAAWCPWCPLCLGGFQTSSQGPADRHPPAWMPPSAQADGQ